MVLPVTKMQLQTSLNKHGYEAENVQVTVNGTELKRNRVVGPVPLPDCQSLLDPLTLKDVTPAESHYMTG